MAKLMQEHTVIYAGTECDLLWYEDGHVRILDKESRKIITRWNPRMTFGNLGDQKVEAVGKKMELEEKLVNIMASYGFEPPFDLVLEQLLRDWLKKGHLGLKSLEKFEEHVEKFNAAKRAAEESATKFPNVTDEMVEKAMNFMAEL